MKTEHLILEISDSDIEVLNAAMQKYNTMLSRQTVDDSDTADVSQLIPSPDSEQPFSGEFDADSPDEWSIGDSISDDEGPAWSEARPDELVISPATARRPPRGGAFLAGLLLGAALTFGGLWLHDNFDQLQERFTIGEARVPVSTATVVKQGRLLAPGPLKKLAVFPMDQSTEVRRNAYLRRNPDQKIVVKKRDKPQPVTRKPPKKSKTKLVTRNKTKNSLKDILKEYQKSYNVGQRPVP